MLLHMRADYRKKQSQGDLIEAGLHVGNVVISERAHLNLFKKGIIKEMVN